MKIRRKEFTPASNGWHVGVIADVVDLTSHPTKYGLKDLVKFHCLLNEKAADGRPVQVSVICSASLHPDSKLASYLRALGVSASTELDTGSMIGKACRLQTEQHTIDGRIYANVTGWEPLRRSDKLPAIPLDYRRPSESRSQKPNGKPIPAPAMEEELEPSSEV